MKRLLQKKLQHTWVPTIQNITVHKKKHWKLYRNCHYFYDEPFADSSAIPTSLVSKIAREKVTVALSADAGDEIFAGYNRYDYISRFGKKLQNIPGFMRKSAAAVMDVVPADAIPVFNKKYLFHSRYEKIKTFLKNPSEQNILKNITQQMTGEAIDPLFKNPVHFCHLLLTVKN